MKTIPIALAAEYAASGSTLCVCLKVTRSDAVVIGFTSLNAPLTVSGVIYEPGFEPSDIVSTSGLGVDNLDLTVLPDAPGGLAVDRADLIAGLWDGADFEIFECNWKSPTDGVNILKRGKMGEAQALRGAFKIELRSLKQALQQAVGRITSKNCPARLGDSKCTKDLTTLTHDVAVTVATTRHVFTVNGTLQADDYYGDGYAEFLDGANAGYRQKIRSQVGYVITLSLAMPFAIGVADSVRLVAGCRKRLIDDCKTKHNNVVNFQGEPHVPGADKLTADPDPGGAS